MTCRVRRGGRAGGEPDPAVPELGRLGLGRLAPKRRTGRGGLRHHGHRFLFLGLGLAVVPDVR
jgi:hypothetical protein